MHKIIKQRRNSSKRCAQCDKTENGRIIETEKRFEGEFISLARKVYFTNDERFRLKNEINLITSSEIREVKDYVKY